MATVKPYPLRSGYRVRYWLSLNGHAKIRSKYTNSKAEADALAADLSLVERATKTGIAELGRIAEWISRKYLTTDDAIIAFRGFKESAMRSGMFTVPADYDELLSAYRSYAERNHRKHKGQYSGVYRAEYVVRWLKNHELQNLSPQMIDVWQYELSQQFAPWTVFSYMTTLRILLDEAVRLGMLGENPSRNISLRQPKKIHDRRVLSAEEVRWLLDTSLNPMHQTRLNGGIGTIVRLGLYAGLRPSEMVWLKWDSINFDQGIVSIGKVTCEATGEVWVPKDCELRHVDLKPAAIEYLKMRREVERGPFVLSTDSNRHRSARHHQPCTSDAPQRALRKMLSDEGKDPSDITVYTFRHTYATTLLRSGVDLRTVQHLLGHADIKTTQEYLHPLNAEQHPTDALPY